MKRALFHIFTFVVLALGLTACIDGPDEIDEVIGEGASRLTLGVEFRPMASQLTRTAGDAIKHIEELHVVVYKEDGTLYGLYPISTFTTEEAESPTNPNTDPAKFAESSTCRATFTMDKPIPFGKYRFYVVANYTPDEAQVQSEDDLRNISLEWNASNVAENNAMFGYFTTTAEVPTVDKLRGDAEAPLLTINKAKMSLYAWVRRAASKVTVAFDGTNLYENIYIYIHTVQIKDIPTNCLLGEDNTPDAADELIADGEVIYHRAEGSTTQTEGLRVTKGIPTGISYPNGTTAVDNSAVHSETANALYFFENMQGKDDKKHQYKNYDSKDNKPYGSYIEVKGYYVNKTAEAASQGEIIYRFMLGKDITTDFNAERNNHYKLTLKFKNNANDPDWHIEYEPENPEISVPSPMYISYLHGEKLDIPVVVRGAEVVSFYAKIIDNDWYYDGHPGIHTDNDFDYNGFLSFVEPDVNGNIAGTAAWRESDFAATDESTDAKVPAFKVTSPEGKQEYHYVVPVWTRHLQQGQGFSGNNAYIHKERTAKVQFTVVVKDADGNQKTLTETIEVIQVKRVVNPAGVWRPASSTKEFHIVQMESDAVSTATYATPDQAVSFRPTVSDGPWAAEIIEGADWVRISKTNGSYGTAKLEGSTGTNIDFYYKPANANSTGQTRCGVIRITYHNNTCVHYIFVSQGLAPVAMGSSKTKWHMTNLHCQGVEEATPLHEGSMFRYRNTYAAILAENNYRPDIKTGYGYGPFKPIANYSYTTDTGGYWTKEDAGGTIAGAREWPLSNDGYPTSTGSLESEYTLRINRTDYNFTNAMSNASVATAAQWNELVDLERYFGVLYGENSTETKLTADDAYEFPFVGVDGSHTDRNSIPYNYDKGMRGMFVWDSKGLAGRSSAIGNGHLFFPVGATGHGHRLHFPDWNSTDNPDIYSYEKIGELKYATMSEPLGDTKRPMLDDLYLSPGAIYWTKDWINNTNNIDDEPGYTQYGQNAQDINYHTYDFNTYSEYATWRRPTSNGAGSKGNLSSYYYDGTTYYNLNNYNYTQGSDACFIRCVEP